MQILSKRDLKLWAKKRRDGDGRPVWLPLITHSIDTESTINYLFNHWLSSGQQQILMHDLSESEIQRLIKFLGFSHDIGKATPVFQTKASYDRDHMLDDNLIEQLNRSGFSELKMGTFSNASRSPHALAGEAILEDSEVPESIGAIIGAHHGKPASNSPYDQIETYTANYYQSDSDEHSDLQELWRQTQKDLLNYGLQLSGYQSVSQIPAVNQPQAVILEGLLIMADWLASSEYLGDDEDKPLFPLIQIDETSADINMKRRFENAMQTWNLSDKWEPQKVVITSDPYKARWGFKARPVQETMTKAIDHATDPGMVIVEAPMGIGKTEIALLAAEQLAYKKGQDGVFVGLPTQATTNAMFDRVDDWLLKIARSQEENFTIKLMHSKAQFNPKYQSLPRATNVEGAGAITVNSWFSGKKSILTKFTVGTIDNLLLMGLKQKHLFLKHLGFSGKVVIIDEVHAYDIYMNQYLYKAINWLGAYHVPIIILSATLPKEKRNALLTSYLTGRYGEEYQETFEAPKHWEDTQAYPLLSILDGNELKQVSQFDRQSGQPPVKLKVERIELEDTELIKAVLKKIQDGGVAGVVVNTVKRAQTLGKLVPKGIKLMILHSSFLANERERQEEQLQKTIGKGGDRPAKMIVIGTQVLEQSLDIDFDVLYTDVAPMDLILQRAGRLQRHQIGRPKALQKPELYVMGINDFGDYGDANEDVYNKYLLMKTDYFLPNTIKLPADISTLVQAVYDPKTDLEVPGIKDAKAHFDDYLEKEEQKAGMFQVEEPDLEDDATIHGWLDCSQSDVDKDEQKANAAVRDIKETLEVILVKHTNNGDFLLDGRPLESVDPQEIAQQVIRLPSAVTPDIDKAIDDLEDLTSKFYSDWQNSAWLKGSLALPLDDDLSATFGNWCLTYMPKFGLSYSKEDDDG